MPNPDDNFDFEAEQERAEHQAEEAKQAEEKRAEERKAVGTEMSQELKEQPEPGQDLGGPDPRSEEQKQAAIREHAEIADLMSKEETNRVLDEAKPVEGGLFLGGMDIVDTRESPTAFQPNMRVSDPNVAAKAEMGRGQRQAVDNDLERAYRTHPNDPTTLAEAAARR